MFLNITQESKMIYFTHNTVRWLKKFKNLWSIQESHESSPAEIEEGIKKSLEQEYLEKKESQLNELFSVFKDEETTFEERTIENPKEYDAGDVQLDELFDKSDLESHYELNVVEAKLDGSDDHLIDVEKIEP
ncbi:MAG: hypothetical protein CMB56_005925 [Methanobacteriota archaeon]|nr:MAG: hypothetical protein CMB56_005925 [Euryarchaeota archaeon]|tara:strand:- start:1374 stop:1769 length:396 start_codon:yes stop_codon:yes gene_type:complete